jgi:hypothetical protein
MTGMFHRVNCASALKRRTDAGQSIPTPSVVDPDGTKLFAGSGSGKNIPNSSSSESEINMKQNYSEKLVKFDNFLTKMLK